MIFVGMNDKKLEYNEEHSDTSVAASNKQLIKITQLYNCNIMITLKRHRFTTNVESLRTAQMVEVQLIRPIAFFSGRHGPVSK